jgi:hypothetical protein
MLTQVLLSGCDADRLTGDCKAVDSNRGDVPTAFSDHES